jgi:hypothetical protein
MSNEQKPPKRSALSFSLRSLLVLTAIVAAFFGGRVSMQPALAKRDRIIREHELAREQEERWYRDAQALVGHVLKDAAEPEIDERPPQDSEFQDFMRRHSAGDGTFFLGPIPETK